MLVSLPIGYFILLSNLGKDPRKLLAGIILLFSIGPVTKYIVAGFYFGGGDILMHVKFIEQLLRSGDPATISSLYSLFPAYHILMASTSLITSLPAYDSLMIMGLICLSLVLLFIYVIIRAGAGSGDLTLPIFTILLLSLVPSISFYTSYFYPQSMAITLLVIFLYTSSAYTDDWGSIRFAIISIVVMTSLVLTHHLTIVLASVPIVLLPLIALYIRRADNFRVKGLQRKVVYPALIPITLLMIAAVTYWSYIGTKFVVALLHAAINVIPVGGAVNTGGGEYIGFGGVTANTDP
ncbi:MAG: hypothetical protein ABEI86_05910, partial [Halobacteriaceae archaeon]